LEEYARKWRFEINVGKSKVMVCGEGGEGEKWWFGGRELERVGEYKYLGVWMSEDGKWEKMVKKVVEKGKRTVSELGKVLWNREVSVEVKMRLWKAIGEARMKYGMEVWWADKLQKKCLERVELGWSKKVLGVGVTTNDEFVKGELELKGLVAEGERMRLRWLGRLCVMDEGRWAKRVSKVQWGKRNGGGGVRRKGWVVLCKELVKKYRLEEELRKLESGEEGLEEWFENVDVKVCEGVEREWRLKVLSEKKLSLYSRLKKRMGTVVSGVRSVGGVVRSRMRSGMVGLGEEIGRYEGKRGGSGCKRCGAEVESVRHVIEVCPEYREEREEWWRKMRESEWGGKVVEGEMWRWMLGDESLELDVVSRKRVERMAEAFCEGVWVKRWGASTTSTTTARTWTTSNRVESMEKSKAPLFQS
jgi:hypothetical protein